MQRTAKRRLAEREAFETAWQVEHVGAGAEERTETWGSMVKRRYQPPVRDRAYTSLNDRKNLIFEGAGLGSRVFSSWGPGAAWSSGATSRPCATAHALCSMTARASSLRAQA